MRSMLPLERGMLQIILPFMSLYVLLCLQTLLTCKIFTTSFTFISIKTNAFCLSFFQKLVFHGQRFFPLLYQLLKNISRVFLTLLFLSLINLSLVNFVFISVQISLWPCDYEAFSGASLVQLNMKFILKLLASQENDSHGLLMLLIFFLAPVKTDEILRRYDLK